MCYEESFNVVYRIVDSLGHMIYILRVESNHGDSAVFHHMDMMLVDHIQTLRFGQASIRKHADLLSNVLPSTGCF